MSRPSAVLPEAFLERLRRIVPAGQWTAVIRSFEEKPPTTFRVNTLKAHVDSVREALAAAGFQTQRVSWYKEALILRSGRLRELQETDVYKQGLIYVQSLSSMLPALILDPKSGEAVLDLTAAPGSKTTQIACLMQGKGQLVANDNNKVRFFKLRANLALQGVSNAETTMRYGEAFGREHPDSFDRVLADVPCSAEGRFDAHEPKSYRFWKPTKVKEMAHKQKGLLASAIHALRPGGVLVYSTCTFAPEENEGVIDWALNKFSDAVSLEPVALGFSNHMPGIAAWDKGEFDRRIALTRRILPTEDMEGFFIAKLRKSSQV